VHAFSTVTNSFNQLQSVPITVVAPQVIIAVDGPAPSSTVSQPFQISGWAIHLGSPPGGTGVDAVHIYAYANGTGPAIFLGAATYGGSRPDVATAYGDAKYTNSAYALSVSGLAPGSYLIAVHAHSTVSGQWPATTFTLTVQ
jgi:hypothetical protein